LALLVSESFLTVLNGDPTFGCWTFWLDLFADHTVKPLKLQKPAKLHCSSLYPAQHNTITFIGQIIGNSCGINSQFKTTMLVHIFTLYLQ